MNSVAVPKWWNIFKIKDSNDYKRAIECLDRCEIAIDKIGMTFPDLKSFDMELKKDEWVKFPKEIGRGVKTMGIHLSEDYRSVICHYKPHSAIEPHVHMEEYEVVKVIEGSIVDRHSGKRYERGDVIFIPKGRSHHIVTEEEECYMYILYTEHEDYLNIPHREEELAEAQIQNMNK